MLVFAQHTRRSGIQPVIILLGLLGATQAQSPTQAPLMNRISSVSPTNLPCASSVTMTVIGPGALGQVHQGFGDLPSELKVRMQGDLHQPL